MSKPRTARPDGRGKVPAMDTAARVVFEAEQARRSVLSWYVFAKTVSERMAAVVDDLGQAAGDPDSLLYPHLKDNADELAQIGRRLEQVITGLADFRLVPDMPFPDPVAHMDELPVPPRK